MSLSCTPIPLRSWTASVALSLLPLLMEPLAWVLNRSRTNVLDFIMTWFKPCEAGGNTHSSTALTCHSSKCIPQTQTLRTCPCCCWPAPPPCSLQSPGWCAQSCPSWRRTSTENRPAGKTAVININVPFFLESTLNTSVFRYTGSNGHLRKSQSFIKTWQKYEFWSN